MEKRFSIRLTEPQLIEFVNMQSNLNDSIKYLIEKEIYDNGTIDLQQYIPRKRDRTYFERQLRGIKNE